MKGHFVREARTGWRNLLGATVGLGSGIGIYTPVSSLFFHALESRFGWSRSAAAASLVALPVTGFVLPLVGIFVDRLGVRFVGALSGVLLSVCFIGLSLMRGGLATFYLLVIALNVLGSGTGPISYTRVIVASFRSSRGVALSVALLGIGVTSMFLPPVLGPLLAGGNWRGGYRMMAAVALLGAVLAFGLIRRTEDHSTAESQRMGVDLKVALKSRTFWILASAVLFVSIATFGLVSQLQSVMVERGLSLIVAARMISLLALSVSLSRLAVGRALDVASPHKVAATIMLMAGTGAMLLLFHSQHRLFLSAVALLLIGMSVGAELDILSFFAARQFGLRRYGSIYGAIALFFYVGIACGGVTYGRAYDVYGSYRAAIVLSCVLSFAAAALLFSLGIPDRRLLARLADKPAALVAADLAP